jgi:hypothetical protein
VTTPFILWLCGAGAGGLGAIFYAMLRAQRSRFRRLKEQGRAVDGVVVGRPELADGEGGGFPVLWVEFTDAVGQPRRVRSSGSSSLFPPVGSRVRVFYDPANPTDAVIQDDIDNAALLGPLFTYLFGGIGMLLVLAGALVFALG